MKLIIDIPEEVVTAIQNGEDYRYDIHTAIAQGIPYEPKGDMISRSALLNAISEHCRSEEENLNRFWYDENIVALIGNAPTVCGNNPKGNLISREVLTKELWKRLVACIDWEEKAKDKETRIRANAVKAFICEVFLMLKEIPSSDAEQKGGAV